MSKWNYQLFENYLAAADQLKLPVKDGYNYFLIDFPWSENYTNTDLFAYCWTPLNKMLFLSELTPREALDHIRDNQSDFHLEFWSQHNDESSYVFSHMLRHTPSIEQIVLALEILMDPKRLDQHCMISKMKYDE